MEEINISKLASGVLNRLAKGQPIRLKGGDDMKILVDKSAIDKIRKAFMKGKGISKSFNEKEVQANLEMKGSGVFGKRFNKFLDRLGDKSGFRLKKYAYQVGDVLKPAVKAGIASALTAGATAIGTAAPVTAPYLPAAVAAGSYAANRFLDKPSDFGVGSGLYAQGSGLYAQGGGFYDSEGNYHGNKMMKNRFNFNKITRGEGLYAQQQQQMKGRGGKSIVDRWLTGDDTIQGRGKNILDQSFTVRDAIKFVKKDIPDAIAGKGVRTIRQPFGGGQLQRNVPKNEYASVGLGGTLLHRSEQHPALRSQPYSVNFQWGSTLPKAYQQFNNGLQ